jgi:hypothetical protein
LEGGGMAARKKIPHALGTESGNWLDWLEPGSGKAMESGQGVERAIGYAQAPLPSQLRFHASKARFKGFSGPVGSGKSTALAQEALRLAIGNPGLLGLIAAPTYPMLRDVTQRFFIEALEDNQIPFTFRRQQNHLILHPWESEIIFRSLENPERLRGTNLAWFGADELTYCKEAAFLRLQARLRHPLASELCGFACWTPRGYDWVYERYIGPAKLSGYEAVRADPFENTSLPPDFYEALKGSYNERFYKQEVLGEYLNIFAGRAYYAFNREVDVQPLEYSRTLPLHWALDFNVDPLCSVIAQLEERATHADILSSRDASLVRVIDEICLTNSNTVEACREFVSRTQTLHRGYPIHLSVYGDASGGARNTAGKSDWQIVQEFFSREPQYKVSMQLNHSNPPVKDRLNTVNALLCNAQSERRVRVAPRCRELIRDLEQVGWQLDSNGNTTAVLDKSDPRRTHMSDALGYFIWHRFQLAAKPGWRPGSIL